MALKKSRNRSGLRFIHNVQTLYLQQLKWMQISELGICKSYLSCKKRYNIKLDNGVRPLGGDRASPYKTSLRSPRELYPFDFPHSRGGRL